MNICQILPNLDLHRGYILSIDFWVLLVSKISPANSAYIIFVAQKVESYKNNHEKVIPNNNVISVLEQKPKSQHISRKLLTALAQPGIFSPIDRLVDA